MESTSKAIHDDFDLDEPHGVLKKNHKADEKLKK
jgi:hypothetical protein